MNKILTIVILLLGACDQGNQEITPRNGSTGGSTTGDVVDPPIEPNLEGCECNPKDPDPCKDGLDCVPTGQGDQFACLAQCGAGSLTPCQLEPGAACIYPFLDAQIGTGPAYCPQCLSCETVQVNACQ